MIISASSKPAKKFISRVLHLTLREELSWEKHDLGKQSMTIRITSVGNAMPEYADVEEAIHCSIDDFRIFLYRLEAKYVMHINSLQRSQQRLVGEKDAASFNQDLATIYRKFSNPNFSKTNIGDTTSIKDLVDALDEFIVNC